MYVDDVLELVEKAVDEVFKRDIYLLKMYDVLKNNKATQKDAIEYLSSSTFYNVNLTIDDLDHYISLGKKDRTYGEAYGYLSKPQARKIKDYLQQIELIKRFIKVFQRGSSHPITAPTKVNFIEV